MTDNYHRLGLWVLLAIPASALGLFVSYLLLLVVDGRRARRGIYW